MSNTPFVTRPGKRLRIFLGEAQEWRGKPLYRAIVEELYHHGIMGATILRGIEGFGPEHHLLTARFPDSVENLPLIIEVVDSEEHLQAVLPLLDRLLQHGTMTLDPVEILVKIEIHA